MKKLGTLALASVLLTAVACNKQLQTQSKTQNITNTARTVGPITFTGQTAWLKFGTRENNAGTWECMNSNDFCQYEYIQSPENHVITDGETTGEIGYENTVLHVAIDISSLFVDDCDTCPKKKHYTRDGEFHVGASGYYTTNGFYIKNTQDSDPTTIGDIRVPAGTYPVYEDETSILIVFEEVE